MQRCQGLPLPHAAAGAGDAPKRCHGWDRAVEVQRVQSVHQQRWLLQAWGCRLQQLADSSVVCLMSPDHDLHCCVCWICTCTCSRDLCSYVGAYQGQGDGLSKAEESSHQDLQLRKLHMTMKGADLHLPCSCWLGRGHVKVWVGMGLLATVLLTMPPSSSISNSNTSSALPPPLSSLLLTPGVSSSPSSARNDSQRAVIAILNTSSAEIAAAPTAHMSSADSEGTQTWSFRPKCCSTA